MAQININSNNIELLNFFERILVKSVEDNSSIKIGALHLKTDNSQQKCIVSELCKIGLTCHDEKENSKDISINSIKSKLNPGDMIIHQHWAATEIYKDELNNVVYSVLNPKDVIGYILKNDFAQINQGAKA